MAPSSAPMPAFSAVAALSATMTPPATTAVAALFARARTKRREEEGAKEERERLGPIRNGAEEREWRGPVVDGAEEEREWWGPVGDGAEEEQERRGVASGVWSAMVSPPPSCTAGRR